MPTALTDFRLCETFRLTREQLYEQDSDWIYEVMALLQLEREHKPKRPASGRRGAEEEEDEDA